MCVSQAPEARSSPQTKRPPSRHAGRAATVTASIASVTCEANGENARLLLLERHAVHVGLAQLEAGALVEAVRGLARGARRQVDGAGTDRLGVLDGCLHEGEPGALAAGGLVDDDVLNPCAHARGDLEGGQGQHAEDRIVAVGVGRLGAEHEEVDAGLGQEALTVGGYGPDYGELEASYIGKNGFRRYWDEEAKAPYLFDGKTFISYEDPMSITEKVAYCREKGLYGIMYWEYKCDSAGVLTCFIREKMDGQTEERRK